MSTDTGKVLGIIAEYNPFHNGHVYHLRESLSITDAETVVAVMSGDFVQRGEPALFGKWLRADTAVRNGVDLVIELPFAYAVGNAGYFAKGAVRILNGLGCVDYLSFGSECGDIEKLSAAAYVIAKSPEFDEKVRAFMVEGVSYPKARHDALAVLLGDDGASVLENPNDILGTEYLKQLLLQRVHIKPVTVMRCGAGESFDDKPDKKNSIAGATAIRELLKHGDYKNALKYIPEESAKTLYLDSAANCASGFGGLLHTGREYRKPLFLDDLMPLISYRVIGSSKEGLAEILSATEGLENRFAAAVRAATDLVDLVQLTDTKRYTETRIKRLIIHTLAGLTKADMRAIDGAGVYARILAFNEKGASLLRHLKDRDCAKIPILTNPNKERELLKGYERLAHFDAFAADIRQIAEQGALAGFSDFQKNPMSLYVEGG